MAAGPIAERNQGKQYNKYQIFITFKIIIEFNIQVQINKKICVYFRVNFLSKKN